jgi:hypothetical protein
MLPDLTNAVWRKASRSGGEGGNCVELTALGAVRDSKSPSGVIAADVRALIAAVKADAYHR